MDVGADAAGQVISLAGQVFKIGMEGMVVVVKIAGKGAAHAAALLAAALSGKKKTRGKVMLKNMLRDSKSLTLFTIKESDLAAFAKEAKVYNVRYCIVKDKNANDGNIDMFIRAEDAAVVNRIIERHGLTAVSQDVTIDSEPERAEGEAYEGENYVYGDVTISREVNSLVEEESETQIKTRVPGTFGKNVRYVYFDRAGIEEAHGGKSYKVHIEPEGSYELFNGSGAVAETVSGEELLSHYDRKGSEEEVLKGNSKARTASEAQSGKSYSAQEDFNETKTLYVAFESYYEYSGGEKEYLYDERCRLLGISENGEIEAYSGHEEFFRNEDELNAYLEEHKKLRYVSREDLEDIAAGRYQENKGQKAEKPKENSKLSDTGKQADVKQPDYVYGDVTISREVNSLVDEAGETDTQIKTRVPGTYGKDIRYVYFDKASLEEVHGGKSYKVHIEPERNYELYNKSGAVVQTVYGEELLTHYDRKDKDKDGAAAENPEAVETSAHQSEKSATEHATGSSQQEKAVREKSYEELIHGEGNAAVPNTRNKFNQFSQRTYDFDAMERELLSNNEPLKSKEDGKPEESPAKEPVPEKNPVSADGMVSTNMGDMPTPDYREIMAGQYGFDSYDELYAAGLRIGGGYDKEPEPESVQEASNAGTPQNAEKYDVLAVNKDGEILAYSLNEETFYKEDRNGMDVLSNTKLPRTEPRSEAEMRPSVREKLDGYKKEEQDNALERQIKEAEAKRERETKRLERSGGDVLPEQRERMNSYAKSREAAMTDFLSDAKIPERR